MRLPSRLYVGSWRRGSTVQRSLMRLGAAVLMALISGAYCLPARGHGFHNAALLTSSLDEWVSQLSKTVPEVGEALGSAQIKAGTDPEELQKMLAKAKAQKSKDGGAASGRKIHAQLSAEQQEMLANLAAKDCLEILAYMDPKNIIPEEFPNFPLRRCGEFRATAKKLLRLMGGPGTAAVAQQLRAELLGGGMPNIPGDLATTSSYHGDLLDVLREGVENGELSEDDEQDLREAASAARRGPQAKLAEEVKEVLETGAFGKKSLRELVELYNEAATGSLKRRAILGAIHKRLGAATVSELVEILESKADRSVRAEVRKELMRRVKEGSELDLVQMLETCKNDALRAEAEAVLQGRKPTFAQLEPQVPGLVRLLDAKDTKAAEAARKQLERGFLIAPLGRCLAWLGSEGSKLDELIYNQLDIKVDRAQADRRGEYLQKCLAVLQDAKAGEGAHRGALRVLGRLRDPSAVEAVVDLLPQLPRKVWPAAGQALEQITGMSYGPKEGDGVAELTVARKRWKEWLSRQEKQ